MLVSTTYRLSNGMVEVIKNGEVMRKVEVPDISNLNVPSDAFKIIDPSTPGTMIDTYLEAVDMSYYKLMSQNGLTEHFYRISSWVADSSIENTREVITNLLKLF